MRLLVSAMLAVALHAADQPLRPVAELSVPAGQEVSFRAGIRGDGLAYTAVGLPAGLAIDPRSGLIHGRPAAAGTHDVVVQAANSAGAVRALVRITVAAPTAVAATAGGAPPPPPPAAADSGEEDQADPMLASGSPQHEWTDNQRRVIHHWFLPGAASLPEGDWYYRVSHVARQPWDEDTRTNLLGLDDSVKIGIMVAYAPWKATTLSVQRVNGRDLALPQSGGTTVKYDTWDTMVQYQLLDQRGVRGLIRSECDLSLMAGTSWMLRNRGSGDTSLNLGVMAERDFFDERLRLGVGLVRAGLSSYESAVGSGPPAKLFPDEQAYLASQGSTVEAVPRATVAIPVVARIALSQHWCLLGEMVQPIGGYRTGFGPALAGGFAIDTNTHEFAFIFTNTANASFNSVITGGAQRMAVPLFAFSICAYL